MRLFQLSGLIESGTWVQVCWQLESLALECKSCSRLSSLRAGSTRAKENAHELDRGQLQKVSIPLAEGADQIKIFLPAKQCSPVDGS
jgi:hypothetical protein